MNSEAIKSMKNKLLPSIETERLVLRYLEEDEASLALDYFRRNDSHLSSTRPKVGDDFLTLNYWENQLTKNIVEYQDKSSVRFFVLPKDENRVVGVCTFFSFVRGPFQRCILGYNIDQNCQGLGYMTEAVAAAIDFVFKDTNIHKIDAYYMPDNEKSGKILERLGFYKIGLAKDEIYLSGEWKDHVEMRLVNPNWKNNLDE